jgi:D-inositol-3-phosphate glycosyltransferase
LNEEVRKRCRQPPLAGRVIFLGKKKRSRLAGYYRSADLVCVPSLSDTLPAVALEALVCGTPVLGTDVGGIPFIVKNGENGIIVPPRDPMMIAEALSRLREQPDVLDRLRRRARDSVYPLFTWERAGMELYKALKEMAKTSDKSSSRVH